MPDNVTVPGDSLSEEYGDARVFAEGQFMFSEGSPMDYRADFTIQFWANVATPQPSLDTVLYSDWDTDVAGGTIFFRRDRDAHQRLLLLRRRQRQGAPAGPRLGFAAPRDDAWHFFA